MKQLHLKSPPKAYWHPWHLRTAAAVGQPTAISYDSCRSLMVGGLAAAAILLGPGQAQAEGPVIPACVARTSCVSTSSFLSPSNYLPPWLIQDQSIDSAARQLTQEIEALGGSVVSTEQQAEGTFIRVRLPGSGSQVDAIDVLIKDGVVLFRSQAEGVGSLPPPACWRPGCISGPPQRGRMEALRDKLGWLSMETDEDKKWVQILFH